MVRTIEISAHDAAWREAFAREAVALSVVFGDALLEVHHIGSTAVPGLPAKPIIDLLAVLRGTESMDRFSPGMRALGYRVRGECLDAEIPGTPGRFYFSKDTAGVRTHQVHACALGHPDIADKMTFRDYLRTHPDRARSYGELKFRVALEHPHDIVAYQRAKQELVQTLLAEARKWRAMARPEGP